MKKIFFAFSLLSAFTVHAASLQLHECKFANTTTEFTPSAALTAMLKKDVNNSVVYKVKFKIGPLAAGPKDQLAVVDELPSKTLAVSFFDLDETEGPVYLKNKIFIDLKSPIGTDAPLIKFEADLNDEEATEGSCQISL